MRKNKISWRRKCPLCNQYRNKEDFHGLSNVCVVCRSQKKTLIPTCKAITQQGNTCTKTAWKNGYCKQHHKQIHRRNIIDIINKYDTE